MATYPEAPYLDMELGSELGSELRSATAPCIVRAKEEPDEAVPPPFRCPPGGNGPPWSLSWRRSGRGGGQRWLCALFLGFWRDKGCEKSETAICVNIFASFHRLISAGCPRRGPVFFRLNLIEIALEMMVSLWGRTGTGTTISGDMINHQVDFKASA